MRGDFLGQAYVEWEDLEVGRELNFDLVQREGVKGGSVTGTIKLLVGEPMMDVVEEEQEIVSKVSTAPEMATGGMHYEKAVYGVAGERKEVGATRRFVSSVKCPKLGRV